MQQGHKKYTWPFSKITGNRNSGRLEIVKNCSRFLTIGVFKINALNGLSKLPLKSFN
jgi:hypothetical protein